MSLITYPLDGTEYTADDAALFHATRTTGIYAGNDFSCTVTGADNTLLLSPGIAWMHINRFKGVVTAAKNETAVDGGLPDSIYPRIDHVALQYDANRNTVEAVIKNGVASSNPQPPARTTTELLYEIHLYRVRREPGTVAITAADVTDLRYDANWCGLMAESVTEIDTSAINAQFMDLLSRVNAEAAATLEAIARELEALEAGSAVELKTADFNDVVVPASAYTPYTDADLNAAGFTHRAAVPLEGVTAAMMAGVVFNASDAVSGVFSPIAGSYNGGIYIYASEVPSEDITIAFIKVWKTGGPVGFTNASSGSGGGTAGNAFINPYFVGEGNDGLFPVNQEGTLSWTEAGYTIDGWLIGGGSAELTQAGMILHTESSAVPWLQRLEYIAAGRDYTASILADGVLYSATGKFPDKGGATVTWTNKSGDITITASNPSEGFPDVTFNFPQKSTTTQLTAAALQLGTEQTAFKQVNGKWLPVELPDYATESAKCQRYGFKIESTYVAAGYVHTNTTGVFTITTPVTIRAIPAIIANGNASIFTNETSFAPDISVFSAISIHKNSVTIQGSIGSNYRSCAVFAKSNIFLSCKL